MSGSLHCTCISVHSAWIIRIWARDCHLQVFKIYIPTKYIEWWCQLQTLHTSCLKSAALISHRKHGSTMKILSHCGRRQTASRNRCFPWTNPNIPYLSTTIALDPWVFQHGGCTGFNWKMQHHLLYVIQQFENTYVLPWGLVWQCIQIPLEMGESTSRPRTCVYINTIFVYIVLYIRSYWQC